MGGVKNRKGVSINNDWVLKSDPDTKAVRVMSVTGGKRRMVWAVKRGDSYEYLTDNQVRKGNNSNEG